MHNLERLADNPHYKMTPKEIRELQELRAAQQTRPNARVQYANPDPPKHFKDFTKHKPGLEKKNHERTHRNPLPTDSND